jgi:DNA processing protein
MGHVVISGLARGIDARAHRASLPTGTIAVLAGGFDRIYPSEHLGLAEEIAERGVLVSEMPFEWEPRGRDFPRRNRIVSGLALGTVVIEAARRSGSLITARFALEQGRDVFAVPGSPLDPRAEGTNDLLRDGATFCTGAQDVADSLAPLVKGGVTAGPLLREGEAQALDAEPLWDETDLFGAYPVPETVSGQEFDEEAVPPPRPQSADAARTEAPDTAEVLARLVALLGPSPVPLDELVRSAGVTPASARAALMDLELSGRLEHHGGNLVSLMPAR